MASLVCIYAVGGLEAGDPDPSFPPALVVDDEQPAELLIGRARLNEHLKRQPNRTVKAYRVRPVDDDARSAISALDGWTKLAELAAGLSALHEGGMQLNLIRTIVRRAGHVSDMGRTISVFRESPALFSLADKSRGRLRLGHLLRLGRAPLHSREGLAREVIAKRLSVARLSDAMTPSGRTDADIAALASQLGALLGTQVQVTGSAASGLVRLAWHSAEELQGLFARLAGGAASLPQDVGALNTYGPVRKRWLDVQYASRGEFDYLFGRLLGDESGFGSR